MAVEAILRDCGFNMLPNVSNKFIPDQSQLDEMKKNLVKPVGRKDLPGRPLAYGTTNDFLKFFGLNRISDLPKLSEIKELTFTSEE